MVYQKKTLIEDCHIVYLGGGTFHDTKPKNAKCYGQLPTPNLPREHEEPDSDFVYDPESPWGSPVPHRHTRSMGTPPPQPSPLGASGSSTEPAESSESPDEPDNTPHTPLKSKH